MKRILLVFAMVLVLGCPANRKPQPESKEVVETKPEPQTAKVPANSVIEDVKSANPQADRALIEATAAKNVEAITRAIADEADVNIKDGKGRSPLHHAADRGLNEIGELLITKGANVNTKDSKNGNTPLHEASQENNEFAVLLIAKGADVKAKNKFEHTPLHHAAFMGTKNGETPLDHVEKDFLGEINFKQITELLRKHGGKTAIELKAEGK